jgi:hypothetical protein
VSHFDFLEKLLAFETATLLEERLEEKAMSRISLGVLCGLVFGGLDTALMIPLSFPDKRTAMLGAFIARFGLGFVICNIRLPWPGWVVGLLLGILLSLPDAIITKATVPILASGAVGGLIIGWIAARFGR